MYVVLLTLLVLSAHAWKGEASIPKAMQPARIRRKKLSVFADMMRLGKISRSITQLDNTACGVNRKIGPMSRLQPDIVQHMNNRLLISIDIDRQRHRRKIAFYTEAISARSANVFVTCSISPDQRIVTGCNKLAGAPE